MKLGCLSHSSFVGARHEDCYSSHASTDVQQALSATYVLLQTCQILVEVNSFVTAELLYASVDNSMKTAYRDARELKQLMTSEETRRILERAEQSCKDNPKGIKPWYARDDPDWLTIDPPESSES